MNADPTRGDFADVAAELGLPHPGLVEKDYHVVRALRVLSAVDPADRSQLTTHDGGKTFVYNLPYASVSDPVGSLRPGIKVEVSSWPLLCSPRVCSVSSFIAQAFKAPAEVPQIACVDPAETAADKFVALTRRIAEERVHGDERDPSLLRHVYDLKRLRSTLDLTQVTPMLRTIMDGDAVTRCRKFPAYAADPARVSLDAVQALTTDDSYAQAFEVFVRDMVYGEKLLLKDCLPVLHEMAGLIGVVD